MHWQWAWSSSSYSSMQARRYHMRNMCLQCGHIRGERFRVQPLPSPPLSLFEFYLVVRKHKICSSCIILRHEVSEGQIRGQGIVQIYICQKKMNEKKGKGISIIPASGIDTTNNNNTIYSTASNCLGSSQQCQYCLIYNFNAIVSGAVFYNMLVRILSIGIDHGL